MKNGVHPGNSNTFAHEWLELIFPENTGRVWTTAAAQFFLILFWWKATQTIWEESPAPTQYYDHDFPSLLDENEDLSTFILCFPSPHYALVPIRVCGGVCSRLSALLSQTVSWCLSNQRQRNTELDDALGSLSIMLFMSPSICHNDTNGSFINVECRLLAGAGAPPFHKHLAANGVKPHSLPVTITQTGKAQ